MPFKLKIKAMTKPIIHTPKILSQKLQELSQEQQQQVLKFLETITTKYDKTQLPKTTRIAGLSQGQGWMSDDFNEPLTDEFFSET
jgi:hypothetical protein